MNDFLSRVEAILSGVMNFNPKSRVEKLLMKWISSIGNVEDLETEDKSNIVAAINEVVESGGGEVKPYTSLKRLGSYIYEVTFDKIPAFVDGDAPAPGGCSSYVQNGKLYRNLDWAYSELASFHIICKGFEGVAFSPDLADGQLSNSAISQLPYRLVDGCNDYGIRVSTHVLFNDWDWVGSGNTPLYKIPYFILSSVKSLNNLDTQLEDILGDLYATESLVSSDYLLQFIVTDGVSTYAILPPKSSSGSYVVQDISENPKLTNFRWVSSETVVRTDLQDRPTGVERWNLMPCDLKDLRFTKAYESADRLSEFIGIDGTTKDSTDEELTDIYTEAHAIYLIRERDSQTWQTMHSVVYNANGMESLWVQEDWDKDYICGESGSGGPATPFIVNITRETLQTPLLQGVLRYISDKTNEEIYTAWQNNRNIIAIVHQTPSMTFNFSCVHCEIDKAYFILLTDDAQIDSSARLMSTFIYTDNDEQYVDVFVRALVDTNDLNNFYDKTESDTKYALKDDLNEYVAISQGVAQAGKFLVVGDDGNVTAQNLPLYDGSVV